jgi:hypothetical protein
MSDFSYFCNTDLRMHTAQLPSYTLAVRITTQPVYTIVVKSLLIMLPSVVCGIFALLNKLRLALVSDNVSKKRNACGVSQIYIKQ